MGTNMNYKHWLLLGIAVISFNAQAADWPPIVDQITAKAKKSGPVVNLAEFKKLVDQPGNALIIDVREPSEYDFGHVPGAINIPRGLLEFRIWKQVGYPDKIDYGRPIYVYCKLTGRSALAAQSLRKLGFTRVTAVNILIADWATANYPME